MATTDLSYLTKPNDTKTNDYLIIITEILFEIRYGCAK